MLNGEERREAGREVWRHLKRADGEWVDETFIGWPHLDTATLREGLNELGARGLIESRYDRKRVQVRLLAAPKPTQQAMEID